MAGEIQLNSTTMATESSGSITLSNVNSATNRTNLGLGSIATQAADSVSITGGTIGGGVVIPSFVGMIASFAMSSAPTGWIICNGAEYAIADYGDLHTAIGTTWGALTNGSGGAGSTHFRVPDLRGAFLRGTGPQTYNSVNYTGQSVGSFNNDTFKSHVHTIRMTHNGGNASQGYPDKQDGYDNGGLQYWDTESTGDSETRPFNAGINYCIKY